MPRDRMPAVEHVLSRCAKCAKLIPVDVAWEERQRIAAEWETWQSGTTKPTEDLYHRQCRAKYG